MLPSGNVNVGGLLCVRVLRVNGVPGAIKAPYVRITLQPHQKVSRTGVASVNDGHGLPLEWNSREYVMVELVGNCTTDVRFTDLPNAERAGALVSRLSIRTYFGFVIWHSRRQQWHQTRR